MERKLKYLVMFYDGNDYTVRVLESATPDSTAPHVWGLPDGHTIICVVSGLDNFSDFNAGRHSVWMDEQEVSYLTLIGVEEGTPLIPEGSPHLESAATIVDGQIQPAENMGVTDEKEHIQKAVGNLESGT